MTCEQVISDNHNTSSIQRYYQFHSKIYDATRWSFLFGRKTLLQKIALMQTPENILEIGCGTGKNLKYLCHLFPQAAITGIDLSESMLQIARKNLRQLNAQTTLLPMAYTKPLQPDPSFDLILCSYSLSMINPGWEHVIRCAYDDLAPGGLFTVVDFHDSTQPLFKWWMRQNHVRMDGHLLPELTSKCKSETVEIHKAYIGMWEYLLFIGQKVPVEIL